ncbi:NAD(P)H-dependent oxidoreductase [Jannaschia pohangensis]|uniref:Putative NADPH-quinone reductase (Modulator of drug activity B) n=1 Tax=Jannaschia pohangensis TaxID=390807 RepID=A0A1I3I3Y1_9RHOB|nr:NAD(P)H-dependent oxidoreductase [Jannaschia pohangensis]SFI42622.1 Putative NADPH-quinone reductase (modulator of drug activity B) [Jannaschia pohangensis]
MDTKRIFILDGHPAETSLSRSFAETYAAKATAAGHQVRVAHLSALSFDADFGQGNYDSWKPLEPDLDNVIEQIEWANHIVLTVPMWWGGLPARLKGLFDRVLLPGRAFDTRVTKMGMPTPLLGGRTARVIITADTPYWFMRLVYGKAMLRQIDGQILGFVGIKPTRFTWFAGTSHPKEGAVDRWLTRVARLGAAGA